MHFTVAADSMFSHVYSLGVLITDASAVDWSISCLLMNIEDLLLLYWLII